MTFNFLGPGLTVNVEAKVKEQIILDSSGFFVFLKAKRSFALNSQKNLVFVSFSISNHRKIVNI